MPESTPVIVSFGPFRYDAAQRLLFRDGELVPLVPKVIDTLHVLLEHRGRIVEKAELMKLVWPDAAVEEVGLARNISLLRKALEGAAENTYIETIPRRGYRFVGVVAEAAPVGRRGPGIRFRWLATVVLAAVLGGIVYWQFYVPSKFASRKAGAPSLAVVPFECLTPELERNGRVQGFSELLVTALAKPGMLNIVAPSTVRRHQRMGDSMGLMGRLLGLDVLVEGSMQQADGRIHINSRLVDVHTGSLIWAEGFDCPLEEWDGGQNGVVHEIAAQVSAHLAIHGAFPQVR
jgi:DNA-binding winged helix-turn-helix (wHTH) protein/TolB-like protein